MILSDNYSYGSGAVVTCPVQAPATPDPLNAAGQAIQLLNQLFLLFLRPILILFVVTSYFSRTNRFNFFPFKIDALTHYTEKRPKQIRYSKSSYLFRGNIKYLNT